ncbi:hypothetical protein NAU58_05265 [Pseudomonas stutzeri]|uniref:Nitrate/nitrite sensing protein domain-containing protein n=1 Tax=Stutzerimonas stutzeri TaxID=316 RepID=A0A2N8S7R0_STUST|nr:hypothetical protein [Stutzerimonas stutzeri]MCQ4294983.1 hypothetical protein [Stutzerimonas stutzeri]PNF82661.1 hypothetical protein CXK92_04180 [Stutzerimonas stutzeri]
MTITATLAIACALLLLGHYLNGIASAEHSRRVNQLRMLAVQEDLEILRLLQQHRGLGVQSEPAAVALRSVMAANLTQRLQQRSAFPDAYSLTESWAALRLTPEDFDAHSALIETLIETLENRASLPNDKIAPIAAACRELEDVARLRGLCVIASNQGGCTPTLHKRLEALCRRIRSGADTELNRLVGKLERGVIHKIQPRLSPPECFALVTPFIDARLHAIQQCLLHGDTPAQPGLHRLG